MVSVKDDLYQGLFVEQYLLPNVWSQHNYEVSIPIYDIVGTMRQMIGIELINRMITKRR